MKKKIVLFIVILTIMLIPFNIKANTSAIDSQIIKDEKLPVYLFYSKTCTHCKKEIAWLNEYKKENSYLDLKIYEVSDNNELLSKVRKALSIKNSYVPLTIIGSDYFIGYNDDIRKQLEEAMNSYKDKKYCDVVDLVINNKDTTGCRTDNDGIYSISEYKVIPILGEVNVKKMSLPIIAIVLGFVDGFNPCAMWVLIFLITMLFEMKNRKKMWILGITFLVASSFIYLLFMMSWLGIASSLASTWFRNIIALVAISAGIFNLNKYRKERKKDIGCQVTSKNQKSKIVSRIEKIVKEKSYFLSIIGIVLLAFSVNLVELACSAGLPLLFTQILSMNDLSGGLYILYMFIYILFFLIDDLIIFVIAMTTLKITGISNKYTKYSHLIGGIIMFFIGILLIFKPEWIMFNF